MAKVSPALPRARMTENGQELRVVVPARREWLLLLVLPVWIAGVVSTFVLHQPQRSDFVSLTLTLLFVAWALFHWLWHVKGTEEITVNGGVFSVRYSVFGVGKTWEFEPCKMRDLRVSSHYVPLSAWAVWFYPQKRRSRQWHPNGIWTGPLAFDYGAKTYRFGAGMDEAEARDLLPHLLRRLSPDDPL